MELKLYRNYTVRLDVNYTVEQIPHVCNYVHINNFTNPTAIHFPLGEQPNEKTLLLTLMRDVCLF